MFLQVIKNLFKSHEKAQTPEDYIYTGGDYSGAIDMFKAGIEGQSIEPFTIPVYRLTHGASDKDAHRARVMYNNHKARIQNQWVNPYASVNTGNGSANMSAYNWQTVNYYECALISQDPLFNIIFNILSETTLSKWGRVTGTDTEIKTLEAQNRKYKVINLLSDTLRSTFINGGAFIYLDFGGDNLEEPLNLQKINLKSFKGFRRIDPINCSPLEVNTTDATRADYMRPSKWYVLGLGIVHSSYLLRFAVNEPPLVLAPLCLYLGTSWIQLLKQDVANATIASQSMVNYLRKMRTTYLRTPEDYSTRASAWQFKKRLEAMSALQDSDSVYPLKVDEEVLQQTSSLSGFAETVTLAYQLVGAKTGIPTTKLLGDSASGLNATGEGDLKNFYDVIRTYQKSIKDNILIMQGILAGVDTGKFCQFEDFIFTELKEEQAREKAEEQKTIVETAGNLLNMGIEPDKVIDWLNSQESFKGASFKIDTDAGEMESLDEDNTEPEEEGEEKTKGEEETKPIKSKNYQFVFNDFEEQEHPPRR